ncbi:hypothetical protein ASG43_05080 [Aureimonas sp. Leaf454]|uniref:universal stress protein n=1 Tax=Aureimonas sp. Leaf454 TaxID=1736381 RepID=UPI0006FDAD9E|nr:universal stress protein [Aureimonas sp. Leaf454]KQT50664.1 hypothetical protein ASG43_05080 [Aureimonas sp. Leaf454]
MFRDLLLCLDGSDHDDRILGFSEVVVPNGDAHIEAILVHSLPTIIAGEVWAEPRDFLKLDAERAERSEEHLRSRLLESGRPFELRRLDVMPHEVERVVAAMAQSCDLAVIRRPYANNHRNPSLLEALLFQGGCAVLVVPAASGRAPIDRIVVGWRNSAQCTHAIAAAMPLLRSAKEVFLVAVTEGDAAEEGHREPMADLARHLARHDVHAEIRHLPKWDNAADALINEARMTGSNLIVAGAYGRSRFREWILGGVTLGLLTSSDIPLLLAH